MKSLKVLPLLAALLPLIGSCKTTNATSAIKDHERNLCSIDPVARTEINGERTFQLTEECVFNDDVHTMKIHIDGGDFKKLIEDGCNSKTKFVRVQALEIDGTSIPDVGMKVRGNTSKCNVKRQFKFKFNQVNLDTVKDGKWVTNEYAGNKNRTYYGLEELSIRASANDQSMVGEKLASDGYAEANQIKPTALRGPTVYRLGFTKVFITFGRKKSEGTEENFNRLMDDLWYDYKGFYSLAENLDGKFLKTRFQKASEPMKGFYLDAADLGAASLERASYQASGWSPSFVNGIDLDSKEGKASNAELLAQNEQALFKLMDALKPETSDADLERLIEVDNVINYFATSQFNGHWDSLMANANNDSLYFDEATQKWSVIAWDLDNTFIANHDIYKDYLSGNIYQPALKKPNQLFKILFDSKRTAFRTRLKDRLAQLAKSYYSEDNFNAKVDHLSKTVWTKAEQFEHPDKSIYDSLKAFTGQRRKVIGDQLK